MASDGRSSLQRGATASELAPRGLCQGSLQPPHHPHRLGGAVQLAEAAQVAGLAVPLQGRLEHRDGNAEVQVGVGGPRVIVPGVAGDDACSGAREEKRVRARGQGREAHLHPGGPRPA